MAKVYTWKDLAPTPEMAESKRSIEVTWKEDRKEVITLEMKEGELVAAQKRVDDLTAEIEKIKITLEIS